jgi:predicted dehydrogenase
MTSADATIGVGVVGTGAGVRTHLPVWAATAGAEVRAVQSAKAERATAVAEQFGVPHACTTVEELVALDDVDLVVVASTPDLHHGAVMAALRAGKHVLCEKPFALDVAQAAEMAAAAQAAGVLHVVNHEFRMDPALQELRRRLHAGDIGALTYVALTDFGTFVDAAQGILSRWWFEEARGGGWLAAHGSHRIDQLRFLFGEIASVSALLETTVAEPRRSRGTLRSEVDDGYFLMVRFVDGGVGAVLDGAAAAVAAVGERLEVHGTEGTLLLDDDRLFVARRGEALREVPVTWPATPGLEGRGDRMHALLDRAIVAALRSGEPLAPSFVDGLAEQRVLDASRRSAAERRWVDLVG